MKTREDVLELLDLNGFALIREKKHFIYRRDGVQITLSKSPSDFRAHEKAYSEIRNKLKLAGIEPVFCKTKERKLSTQFNTPRMVQHVTPTPPAPTPAANQQVRTQTAKPISWDDAAKIVMPLREQRRTGKEICEELNSRGLLTPTNRVWSAYDISYVAINYGGAESAKPKIAAARAKQATPTGDAPRLTKNWQSALQMITDICMSNMNDESKRAMVKVAAQEL